MPPPNPPVSEKRKELEAGYTKHHVPIDRSQPMEVPDTPQAVTEELLSELDLKGLLDLYAKAFTQSWATVKEAIQAEIERRIAEGRKPE